MTTTTPATAPVAAPQDNIAGWTPAARWRGVWRAGRWPAGAAVIGVAAALPALAGPYVVGLASSAIVLALLAMSTQLLAVAGLPSFGQTAFLGVGAYTAVVLANAGITHGLVQLAAAVLAAAAVAAVTAPFVLRTRGVSFLMVTVMIQGLGYAAAVHWTSVTGGSDGRHTPPVTLGHNGAVTSTPGIYWYAFTVLAVAGAATAVLLRSRLALIWRGHAGHEPRMIALGYRPTVDLGAAYVAAAALAGAGGALTVAINTFMSPAYLSFDIAAAAFAAAALGASLAGRPTMTGALAATAAIVAVRDFLGSNGTGPLWFGLLCLTVPYLRPAATGLRAWSTRRRQA
ncbi:branched-chain amino acid ABC transporter permease [Actinoplanes sp. CA-030573]|uniref:branched-chain amino acid ABC transporter permease n=1 Tax=Actinoplanes sp. CA-030573 TaxID=3239898 RepID=UPI003D8A8E03